MSPLRRRSARGRKNMKLFEVFLFCSDLSLCCLFGSVDGLCARGGGPVPLHAPIKCGLYK
ncbi:hypothetical protein N665_0486s0005 [Sinapis alba]|nr:hypothetical protein N665_0486s0005 [Sinapis alba]